MGWQFDNSITTAPISTVTSDVVRASLDGKVIWTLKKSALKKSELQGFDIVSGVLRMEDSDAILVGPRSSFLTSFLKKELDVNGSDVYGFQDHVYVPSNNISSLTDSFDTVSVINVLGEVVDTIKYPESMNSNLVFNNNKMWAVSQSTNNAYQQVLYWYDLTTKAFGAYPVPVRHQSQKRFLIADYNGFILICDYNNLSISKFTNEGTYVSTTRTSAGTGGANREPSYMTVDQNRNVYVSSFNGMIQRFDSATDTFTSYSNGLGDVHSFVDSGPFLWVAAEKIASVVSFEGAIYVCNDSHIARGTKPDPTKWTVATGNDIPAAKDGVWAANNYYVDDKEDLIRITKSDQSIRHYGTSERDIQIEDTGSVPLKGVQVNTVMISQQFVCSTAVGDVTIPQYVWCLAGNKLVGLPTSSMFRQNYYEMNGTAMLSLGNYDYTGD